jgi:hypothetical protein
VLSIAPQSSKVVPDDNRRLLQTAELRMGSPIMGWSPAAVTSLTASFTGGASLAELHWRSFIGGAAGIACWYFMPLTAWAGMSWTCWLS